MIFKEELFYLFILHVILFFLSKSYLWISGLVLFCLKTYLQITKNQKSEIYPEWYSLRGNRNLQVRLFS